MLCVILKDIGLIKMGIFHVDIAKYFVLNEIKKRQYLNIVALKSEYNSKFSSPAIC